MTLLFHHFFVASAVEIQTLRSSCFVWASLGYHIFRLFGTATPLRPRPFIPTHTSTPSDHSVSYYFAHFQAPKPSRHIVCTCLKFALYSLPRCHRKTFTTLTSTSTTTTSTVTWCCPRTWRSWSPRRTSCRSRSGGTWACSRARVGCTTWRTSPSPTSCSSDVRSPPRAEKFTKLPPPCLQFKSPRAEKNRRKWWYSYLKKFHCRYVFRGNALGLPRSSSSFFLHPPFCLFAFLLMSLEAQGWLFCEKKSLWIDKDWKSKISIVLTWYV